LPLGGGGARARESLSLSLRSVSLSLSLFRVRALLPGLAANQHYEFFITRRGVWGRKRERENGERGGKREQRVFTDFHFFAFLAEGEREKQRLFSSLLMRARVNRDRGERKSEREREKQPAAANGERKGGREGAAREKKSRFFFLLLLLLLFFLLLLFSERDLFSYFFLV